MFLFLLNSVFQMCLFALSLHLLINLFLHNTCNICLATSHQHKEMLAWNLAAQNFVEPERSWSGMLNPKAEHSLVSASLC